MTDANTICHDVDLLGDWLDAKGFTEEAGLCLRVLGLIHAQAEDNKRLRAALKPFADYVNEPTTIYELGKINAAVIDYDILLKACRAAAAALKEIGGD